jgi:hypothetical protein
MQVFITEKSYKLSAQRLDNLRLNKQIIECNQIYKAIKGITDGWKNHCVTRLWEDYPEELMKFATECYFELGRRGKNPCKPYKFQIWTESTISELPHFIKLDWWLNAMRSHLLAKDYEHYSKFKWTAEPVYGYYAINKYGDWQKYSVRK